MDPIEQPSLSQKLQEAARQRTVLDVGAQRVGKVYAEALYHAAAKENQAGEVLEEFDALVDDLFRRDPRLEAFLSSTAIGRDRKRAALDSAFGGKANPVFVNFLQVLNNHDRLDVLRAVHAAYRNLFDQKAGRMRVEVQSAVPLADDQRQRLVGELRQAFGREPVLDERTDPELIAGLVVRVGDWVYDTSLRSRLRALRNDLIERSSYEIQSRRDRFCSPNGD